MKFLVTGGSGFIGSNIVDGLLAGGHSVRVIDNFSTGKRENLNHVLSQIELVEGDIRSYHIVQEVVDGVDVILHQAALPSVPRSIKDPITSNEVNVVGTLNILQAANDAKIKRIVFASSSSVYGDNPELPKHEGMIPNPLSPYAVSKLAGEKYCGVFSRIYGLETVSLRYFNVFGQRQDPNSIYSAVIPKFIKSIMNNQSPIIFGDGEQSRDFTFIANVVHGNILAGTVQCESGLFANCACHDRITLNQLVAMINKYLDKNVKPIYKDPRQGDIKHSFAAIDKAKEKLGYEPLVKFEDGLHQTIDWFIKTGK